MTKEYTNLPTGLYWQGKIDATNIYRIKFLPALRQSLKWFSFK